MQDQPLAPGTDQGPSSLDQQTEEVLRAAREAIERSREIVLSLAVDATPEALAEPVV